MSLRLNYKTTTRESQFASVECKHELKVFSVCTYMKELERETVNDFHISCTAPNCHDIYINSLVTH